MRQDIIDKCRDSYLTEAMSQFAGNLVRETLLQTAAKLEHEYQIRADILDNGREICFGARPSTFNRMYEQRQIVRAMACSYLKAAMLVRSEI